MLKICLIVNEIKYGGVERVIENYCSDFDRKEFDFTIITPNTSSKSHMQYFRECGFKVEQTPHKKKNLIGNICCLYRIIKKGNFDIIHSHMSYVNFYVLFIGKILGVKVRINHYHNVFHAKGVKKQFIAFCNKLCDRFSTLNIFCSDAVKEYFGKTRHNSLVLYNIVKLDEFQFNKEYREILREKYNISKSEIVIGNIGRFTKQKNQIFILEIFLKMRENNRNLKLMLCGDGEDREIIERFILKYGLSDSVILTGNTSEVHKMYSAMDVFLFPSIFEGLGLTFLEAQLNGLPCIGSDVLPKEVIVSRNVKLLNLQENKIVWCDTIDDLMRSRENNIVSSRINRYNYDEHHCDLLNIYKKVSKSEGGN